MSGVVTKVLEMTQFIQDHAIAHPYATAEHVFVVLILLSYVFKKLRGFNIMNVLKVIPGASAAVDATINKEVDNVINDRFGKFDDCHPVCGMPKNSVPPKDMIQILKNLNKDDRKGNGDLFAYSYHSHIKDFDEMLGAAHSTYLHSNGLNPFCYPSLRKFENDIVGMALDIMNGGAECAGILTAGGTESVLCAVKTARTWARKHRPHITAPEMVMGVSTHPCFDKAGEYFGIKIHHIPMDASYRIDMAKFAKAINRNTILLIGSAPAYPQGVLDPIEEIGALGLRFDIPVHVDACIGGFMLPWVERLGYSVPLWDFRVPGVMSISADVHKYGFGGKGSSVVLYRNHDYRFHQFYSYTGWSGGVFISPSIVGTRPGGPIAAAWAAMVSLGEAGYLKMAEQLMGAALRFRKGINEIEGLAVLGEPHMTIVSFESTDRAVNIHAVADIMDKKFGWVVERQQLPNSIHFSVLPGHVNKVEDILRDLASSVDHVRNSGDALTKEGSAAMYGLVAKVPDPSLIEYFLSKIVDAIYSNPQADAARAKKNASR